MNISSIVVLTKAENEKALIESIKSTDFCEFHLSDGTGKIVVTIEGESVSDEIAALKKLQAMKMVISAEMIYSYTENELNQEKEKIEKAADMPEWLNDDSVDARQIKYQGDLKKKF